VAETETRIKDWNDFANAYGLEQALARVTSVLESKQEQRRLDRFANSGLLSAGTLFTEYPELKPAVIEGCLRRGEVMTLASDPKSKKTWLRDQVALSMLAGLTWLGFQMPLQEPRIMIIDNELDATLLKWRIQTVSEAMSIDLTKPRYGNRLQYKACRGQLEDINQINQWLQRNFEPGDFDFIAIDALYRMIPQGMRENENTDMAQIYNVLDQIAISMDAAVMVIHHASKGSQSGKNVTDVGSGAGSITRSTGTHLIMRRHEDPQKTILEGVARSFPDISPRVLSWSETYWQWIYEPDGVIAYANEDRAQPTKPQADYDAKRPDWVKDNSTIEEKAKKFVETFIPIGKEVQWSVVIDRSRPLKIPQRDLKAFRDVALSEKYCYVRHAPRQGGQHLSREPYGASE